MLTGLFVATDAGTCLAETLGEVLNARLVDASGLDRARLARRITSYASLDDAGVFTIAYYPDDSSDRLGDSLYVDLLQKRAGRWITAEVKRDEPNGIIFGGSVIDIIRSGELLYLRTHVNPSAGYTLVLTTELKFHASVYGWPLAVFPGGLLVFQNSGVHFVPTHYVEISAFDPRSKRSWLIYPRRPFQAVRREHIEKVRAAYAKRGDQWFRDHNHHGNPELFDNFRRGDMAMNHALRAVAFRLAFDNTDTWDYSEKLKFERFGGLGRGLEASTNSPMPPESAFARMGEWLGHIRRGGLDREFLDLFKGDPELGEMLRGAMALPEAAQESWPRRFSALDSRWAKADVWERLCRILAVPPEITEVIVVLRHIDRENAVECREALASDFEKRFGDVPLDEILSPARLKQEFGE